MTNTTKSLKVYVDVSSYYQIKVLKILWSGKKYGITVRLTFRSNKLRQTQKYIYQNVCTYECLEAKQILYEETSYVILTRTNIINIIIGEMR